MGDGLAKEMLHYTNQMSRHAIPSKEMNILRGCVNVHFGDVEFIMNQEGSTKPPFSSWQLMTGSN